MPKIAHCTRSALAEDNEFNRHLTDLSKIVTVVGRSRNRYAAVEERIMWQLILLDKDFVVKTENDGHSTFRR
jgi:hypothetical protein